MKKFISVLTALAMAYIGTAFSAETAVCEDKSGSKPIKIMAIGDSITDGYGVTGSYRKYLYNELTKKGYDIDMVGSKGNDMKIDFSDAETGESFSYDDDNTGYSGYTIKEYPGRNGILETLKSTNCLENCKPDIVILQIGTNNIIDNYDANKTHSDLEELIDYILGNISENSTLFVTTIPDVDPNRQEVYNWFSNYRHSADWQTNYSDEEAEEKIIKQLITYNSNLTALVQKMIAVKIANNWDITSERESPDIQDLDGPYLRYADVASVITNVKTQLMDGVHPNNNGYKLMGEYWADQIDKYLSGQTVEIIQYKVSDLVELQKFILGKPSEMYSYRFLDKYDLNGDETVDIFDLVLLRKELIKKS